ncbi:hypothetical protein BLA29_014527, partial [Euroglyphus maynei]
MRKHRILKPPNINIKSQSDNDFRGLNNTGSNNNVFRHSAFLPSPLYPSNPPSSSSSSPYANITDSQYFDHHIPLSAPPIPHQSSHHLVNKCFEFPGNISGGSSS